MRNRNILVAICAIFMCLSVMSCTSRPKSVLSEKKMKAVMKDLYLYDGAASVKQIPIGDSIKSAAYDAILSKHGVTIAQYDSSMVWYAKHMPEFVEMNKAVVDELQSMQQKEDTSKK